MPIILTEQAQWRDDPSVDVAEREDTIETFEPNDSPALMALLVLRFIQKYANRTRYLKELGEGLGGDAGKLENLGNVDPTGLANGVVIRYRIPAGQSVGTWQLEPLPEAGVTVIEDGSAYQAQLLTANQASADDLVEFESITNTTLALDTSSLMTGVNSLRLRSVAAGDMQAGHVNRTDVTAGGVYRIQGKTRAFSVARSTRIGVEFFDGAASSLGILWGDAATNSNSANVDLSTEVTAPAGSTTARLVFEIQSTGSANEDHYFDDFVLQRKLVARGQLNFSAGVVSDNPAADAVDVDVAAITAQASSILAQVEAAQADLQTQALIYALALGG